MAQTDRFFDLALDLFCVANLQGFFIRTNASWTRVLGWSEAELCGRPYLDFVHPDDRDSTRHTAAALGHGGEVYTFENRYRHKDGSYRWLAWNSVNVQSDGLVYCAARDVTESRRQLALMDEVQAVSGVGSWEIDLDTRRLLWSRETHRVHGTDPRTYQPRLEDGLGFFPEEALASLKPAVERLMTEGRPYTLDLPFLRADGQQIWVRTTANATSLAGKITRCFGTFQDITHERRMAGIESVIRRVQGDFISSEDKASAFARVLDEILQLTGSAFGFIGQVLQDEAGLPYLKTHAITNIAWSPETRALYEANAARGFEFRNLETLFGVVLRTGQALISNDPAQDPRRGGLPPGHPPLASFMGLPIHLGGRLSAMVGVANRQGGYDESWARDLAALLNALGQMIEADRLERAREADRREIARLSRMVSQSSNGMTLTDAEGRVEWINEGFSRFTGYRLEDIKGRTPGSVLQGPETDPTEVARIRESLRRGEGFEAELLNYHKSGAPYWVHVHATPITDECGRLQGFMAIETDVTARRQAEEALRYERDLFSAGPVFSIEWDPSEHWPIRYVSANVQAILGYSPSEMQGPAFHYADLIHPDDRERISQEVATNIAHGVNQYEQSYRIRCQSGEYRWFYDFTLLVRDRRNEVISIRGYLFDQTQLKESEERIRQERMRLDHIITGTNAGTWEWNVQTGETIFNERWAEILGYTLAELSPVSIQTWMALANPEDLKRSGELLEQHFRGELDYYEFESRMRHKQGHWVWVLDRGRVASFTADGQPLWMYGTHQDISERKHLETVKSEFVATVSHELRTPLTSIAGALGLLVGGVLGPVSPQAMEMLKIAHSNAQRLTVLINDLLDIEKLAAGKMRLRLTRQSVEVLTARALNDLRGLAERQGVRVARRLLATDCAVLVDPERLLQVLSNLLSNAIKHSPAGSEVELMVEPRDGQVRMAVQDRGEGVSEDFRPALFEKFSQADSSDRRRQGGTGLGLAISKALTEEMRGKIGYQPREGGGSVFFVEFPLTD